MTVFRIRSDPERFGVPDPDLDPTKCVMDPYPDPSLSFKFQISEGQNIVHLSNYFVILIFRYYVNYIIVLLYLKNMSCGR